MDLSTFNLPQKEGITTSSKYTRIIAGAGSGKTRVLTYRIMYLLEQGLALPTGIMAITFTNKAAETIKNRVQGILGSIHDMSLCTIHSWCARFLRKESHHLNFPHDFTILDEDDTHKVMKDIFASLGYMRNDPRISECLNWISNNKNKGLGYEDVLDLPEYNYEMKEFKHFFRLYEQRKKTLNALDFDDLLLKTIEILKNKDNGVQKRYQSKISHILVDEFQDINDVQFYLITLLLSPYAELYVVGDPDQTIYTWRGANNQIILNLEKSLKAIYKDARVRTIVLNQNYRSTKKILNMANLVIAKNKDRVKKDLISMQEEGEDVSFCEGASAKDSAHYIVNTIKELHDEGNKYNSIAILYRANFVSREIETLLSRYDIPYRIYGGIRFYQRKEIKDLISFFDLLINPSNDLSFLRIINVPKRQIGQKSIDTLVSESQNNSLSLYEYILNSEKLPLPLKKEKALKDLVNILEKTKLEIKEVDKKEIPIVLFNMLKEIGYDRELKEDRSTEEERRENIDELMASMEKHFQDNNATFEDFVSNAILQSSQDEVEDGDYVLLMTVHTAKGLEFDNVFVYRLCEGIFPSSRAIDESINGLEEERRLAYVAFTRAKKRLFLTTDRDYDFRTGEHYKPSRFIKEGGVKPKKNQPNISQELKDLREFYKEENNPYNTSKTKYFSGWNIGDKLFHDTFGNGVVLKVNKDTIVVQFENPKFAQKTLIARHFMLHRR